MRSRYRSTSSRAEISPERMSCAWRSRPANARSRESIGRGEVSALRSSGAMEPGQIVEGLCRIENRGPGTDAERRAARWLQDRLRDLGRPADIGSLGLHALAAVVGSVVSAFAPLAGLIVLGVTLLSLVLDLLGRVHLLRRLTSRRATQNVVAHAEGPAFASGLDPITLVVTAGYDAGRTSLLRRDGVARLGARIRGLGRGHFPGSRGLLVFAVLACAACATGRLLTDNEPHWIAIVQVCPTVWLLVALAAMFDISVSERAPGAGNASAAAVAMALAGALGENPPRRLGVEVVLAGAATASADGFLRYVTSRRREIRPEGIVVLHLEPCGRGTPHWWVKDGPIAPLRFHPRLVGLAARVAQEEAHLRARPYSGRAPTGGWAARSRGWPAITVGSLEGPGYVPGRHQPYDVPVTLDPAAMQATLEFCVALVDALDVDLGRRDTRKAEKAEQADAAEEKEAAAR